MDCDNGSGDACYGVCCWADGASSDTGYLGNGQSECGSDEQYYEYVYEYRANVDIDSVGCHWSCSCFRKESFLI